MKVRLPGREGSNPRGLSLAFEVFFGQLMNRELKINRFLFLCDILCLSFHWRPLELPEPGLHCVVVSCSGRAV